ncbi:MAG TPA: hypothetical protein VGL05_19375 [Kribbella sp.]
MTTPAWNVRATDTALVLEHPDTSLVTQTDADTVYEQVNGYPPPADPNPAPQPPAGLASGQCGKPEVHDAHRATWVSETDGTFEFWCVGIGEPLVQPTSEG